MIVLLVIAILAAIAYPIYTSQVRQARRVAAKTNLTEAVNRAEQYYSQLHRYPSNLGDINMNETITTVPNETTGKRIYRMTVVKSNSSSFEVKATAIYQQRQDNCKYFTLRANGRRSSSAPGKCWPK